MFSSTTASKRLKYLGINLTKEMPALYPENLKRKILKIIKEFLNKWIYIWCCWIGSLNITKMVIFLSWATNSMPNPYQNLSWHFSEIDRLFLNSYESAKQSEKRRTKWEGSHFLISKHTAYLQLSKLYVTDIRKDV